MACDVVDHIFRADAQTGRRRELTASPVAVWAQRAGLPLCKTNRLDSNAVELIRNARPDLGIVVAYGALIPDEVLTIPRLGWINLHFSLLPAWRGAAPVQRSLAAGDPPAWSIMRVVSQLDAGPVYRQGTLDLGPDVTGGEALTALSTEGAVQVADIVGEWARGVQHTPTAQQGTPSYAHKLSRADGRIDWSQDVTEVYRRIRAMTPEPGAWTTLAGQTVKILQAGPAQRLQVVGADKEGLPGRVVVDEEGVWAQCRDGFLPLRVVQPAGKTAMSARDWARGRAHRMVFA